MNTHETPETKCPVCVGKINACTGVDHDSTPNKDDVTLCFGCGTLLFFNEDLTVRIPTVTETKNLSPVVVGQVEYIRQALSANAINRMLDL